MGRKRVVVAGLGDVGVLAAIRLAKHFDVVGVYGGVSVLVINYRNQRGDLVCEVLEFDGAKVRRGHGTYLSRS